MDPSTTDDTAASSNVRSVDRAVALLETLAERPSRGVTELARELGTHKSTAFRLLATLEAHELVEQHPVTAKYRLGRGIARLAFQVSPDLDRRDRFRRVCERLAASTRETVNAAVLDGDAVLHIEQVIGSDSVVQLDWLWRRDPLHCTAAGKVFLAELSADRRGRLLPALLQRFTPRTIVERDVLDDQLAVVRDRGYAVTVDEFEIGLSALAAPMRDTAGEVTAALVVSGPTNRMPGEHLDALARTAMDHAASWAGRT